MSRLDTHYSAREFEASILAVPREPGNGPQP